DLAYLAQTTWILALLRLGKLGDAMHRAQNTLNHVRRVGNRKQEARVLNAMGMIAHEQKDLVLAQNNLVNALSIARETKDRGLEQRALNNLAMLEGSVNGDYVTANLYYLEAYNLARELGDRNAEGITLANLGYVAGVQGDFVSAHQYHEQSLSLA